MYQSRPLRNLLERSRVMFGCRPEAVWRSTLTQQPSQRADRRPTLEDVAARAGVSRALVSIVIRGAPGASEQTRERVLQAAAELRYRPDTRARLLSRSRSQLL